MWKKIAPALALAAAMAAGHAAAQQPSADLTVTVGRAYEAAGALNLTFTVANAGSASYARVDVSCALLDEAGQPQSVAVHWVTNLGPGTKGYGEAQFLGRPKWKTPTCRITSAR